MVKKHVGSRLAVVAIGAVMGGVFACSSSNSPGFPESGDGGTSTSTATTSSGTTSGSYTGTTSGGTSSGYEGTSSGTTSGTTTGTTSSGTTSGTTLSSGATTTCTPTSTGGIALMTNFQTTVGTGYAYAFDDGMSGGPSTACVESSAFCGTGTAAACPTPGAMCYGGGIGINVNQTMGTGTAIATTTATGTGIAYALSAATVPAGLRLVICTEAASPTAGCPCPNGPDMPGCYEYCATISSPEATVTWSDFSTDCYDMSPKYPLGTSPPMISQVQFQVSSGTTAATPWDFCVTSLSL